MKPVMQTIFNFEKGDCMRACVASIFELDIEVVPNFHEPSNFSFAENLTKWGRLSNLIPVDIRNDGEDTDKLLKDCWLIAAGKSPRGKSSKDRHAVVWYNGILKHDPHPDKLGLKGDPETFTIFIILDCKHYSINK